MFLSEREMTSQEEKKILLPSSDDESFTEDEDFNATSMRNSKRDLPSPNDVRVIVIKDVRTVCKY